MAKQKLTPFTQLDFLSVIDNTKLQDGIIFPDDSPEYKKFLADWSKSSFHVLDLETMETATGNGLDPWRGKIRLYQIGLLDGRVLIYDSLKHNCKKFFRVMKAAVENKANKTVGHNIYFDLSFLKAHHDINGAGIRCTRILSVIRWCGLNKYYRFGLKDVFKRLYNEEMSKEQQRSNWNQPNLSNTQLNYAADDITNTMRVFKTLCHEIRGFDLMPDLEGNPCEYNLSEIAEIECEVIPAFVSMAFNGAPVNLRLCDAFIRKYRHAMQDLFEPIKARLNLDYSANAVKLAAAIYREYGIWLVTEDKDSDKDEDNDVDLKQLSCLIGELPDIAKGDKLSTTSANLFQYYEDTGEDDLLKISLVRSLKKQVDCLESLRLSAMQNNDGRARSKFTSLGSTGTGRSTSGSDRIGTANLLNLQNLPNPVKHPLIKKYKLKAIRRVLRAPKGSLLSINDYSGSHLNLAIKLSQCESLLKTKTLKDSHSLYTSTVMQAQNLGDKYSVEYCGENKEKDPVVGKNRKRAKTAFFASFNGSGAFTIFTAFTKTFTSITLDDCKTLVTAFKETFKGYTQWQRKVARLSSKTMIDIKVHLKNGRSFPQQYGLWRTPCGRLIHSIAYPNKFYDETKKYSQKYTTKLPDITSAHLLSAEAIALKKTMIKCNEFLLSTHYGDYVKMILACHDELDFEIVDNAVGREGLEKCLEFFAIDFNKAVGDNVMKTTNVDIKGTLAKGYDEK